MYKILVTDLDSLTMPLMNGCCNDDVIQLGPFRSQLLFHFVQMSDVFCTLSFPVFYTYCNQLASNLVNLEAAVKAGYILECL